MGGGWRGWGGVACDSRLLKDTCQSCTPAPAIDLPGLSEEEGLEEAREGLITAQHQGSGGGLGSGRNQSTPRPWKRAMAALNFGWNGGGPKKK